MKPNEQDVNPSKEGGFDPAALYRLAEAAAAKERVPPRWREDAVAEYVAGAWIAAARDNGRNLPAYQCRMGRGAIKNFVRRERRREALPPGACPAGAKRVSMEKTIMLADGEAVPMAETIEDGKIPQPDARMLEAERNAAVRRAMGALDPVARAVVQRVLLEDRTQREAAEALGLSRQAVQRILAQARLALRARLSAYESDFNRTRH